MEFTNFYERERIASEQNNLRKRTQKNTKNAPCEKGEFVGFVINEQKKDTKRNFEEILKNYPEIKNEITQLINERDEFFEENISLGEQKEALENEVRRLKGEREKTIRQDRATEQDNIVLQSQNEALLCENEQLNKKLEELMLKVKELTKENKLMKKNRGVGKLLKDKAQISLMRSENAELKDKLAHVGRQKISDTKINEIVRLRDMGWGYDRIAKQVQVSKSTVCKYVNRS